MYEVVLSYHKKSGKYYSEGSYGSDFKRLGDILDEVKGMQRDGKLPGLCEGCGKGFTISVDVPGHPDNHPMLLAPIEKED